MGINRQSQRTEEEKLELNGFFKKEYIILNKGYSFLFYAQVEDHFPVRANTVAYVGQGRTPFAVHMEAVGEDDRKPLIPACCVPDVVQVNGEKKPVCCCVALSDCYYPGDNAELRSACSLMLAESRDYRVFTTNYQARGNQKRYRKHECGLKLLQAGSVFLFFGSDTQTPAEQMAEFRARVHQPHAEIAGFNQFYFSV